MKNVKNMKLLIVICVFSMMLMGCVSTDKDSNKKEIITVVNDKGNDEENGKNEKNNEKNNENEADDGSGEAKEEDKNNNEDDDKDNEGQAFGDVKIEQQVLFEQDGVKVTATEYVTDEIWGDGIKLLIENNSSVNVRVGCSALVVNDYMITDLFTEEVAAGKKSNETLNLSATCLEQAEIETVGKIEAIFEISNPVTYETISETGLITIKTSAFDIVGQTKEVSGQELLNENGVRIVGKYINEDDIFGKSIVLYIENNTGTNINVQCGELSVNGFMMTEFFSAKVLNGKKIVDDILLSSSDLEENGITDIENVELKFEVHDDNYQTLFESGLVKFAAK